MQTLSPDLPLLLWPFLSLSVLALIIFAIFRLLFKYDFLDKKTKLIWVLVILFIPFLGSILFLAKSSIYKQKKASGYTSI